MRRLTPVVAMGAVLVAALLGCERSSTGAPVRADAPDSTTETTTETSESTTESTPGGVSMPGVERTQPDTVPPDALACFHTPTGAGSATAAQVADAAAPRITITVPPGWTSSPGAGSPADLALTLSGPEGMTGQVTIASTPLDPGAAFTAYGDAVINMSAVAVLNVMPAEFCGYSSQRLFGNWSDKPGESVEFADRITHIWTNAGDYLVAVHMQGPAAAPGFDEAKDILMTEFSIDIP